MGQAIGQMLPSAVGVAVSPLPIVAVVLMLATPKGRLNGPAFLGGWWLGLAAVGAITLSVAGGASGGSAGEPPGWVSWLKLVLGLLLLLVGAGEWRRRPQAGDTAAMPKWMGALEAFTPVKAAGAGALLSALNPKNLLLSVAGAVVIAQAGISTGEEVAAYVVFVAIASIGVAAPIVIFFALGSRSRRLLDAMKDWLARNNAVIMAVLVLVIGVKLIGDAISGFSA
jgi:hypothetical protein